jgi:hypothetical protein
MTIICATQKRAAIERGRLGYRARLSRLSRLIRPVQTIHSGGVATISSRDQQVNTLSERSKRNFKGSVGGRIGRILDDFERKRGECHGCVSNRLLENPERGGIDSVFLPCDRDIELPASVNHHARLVHVLSL